MNRPLAVPPSAYNTCMRVLIPLLLLVAMVGPLPVGAAPPTRTGASAAGLSAVSPAEALGRAEESLNARDGVAASRWLEPLLVNPHTSAELRWEAQGLLARAWLMRGDNDAAMDAVGAALAGAQAAHDGAAVVAALRERVAVALQAGRTDVAAQDLASWEALAEEAGEAQLLLEARIAAARFLLDRGNAALALERLSALAAQARGTDLATAYLAVGEVWLAKGDAARAAEAYTRVLSADAQAAEAWAGRARARAALEQWPGARADLAAAQAALPHLPSSLARDLLTLALATLADDWPAASAGGGVADEMTALLAKARAAATAGQWEDARDAAESAIMRDRNAVAPRVALAEIYLLQGEYGGAANVFSSIVGLGIEVRYPRVGGTLAQGLMGVEVYDVAGFAEDWRTLRPEEQAALRAAVAAARARGALAGTASSLVRVVEAAP